MSPACLSIPFSPSARSMTPLGVQLTSSQFSPYTENPIGFLIEKSGASPVHLLKKQVVLLIIVFCGCMWLLIQIDFSRTTRLFKFDKYGKTDYSSTGFLIDTKGCRILDLDPFDPSLIQYFGEEEPIVCDPEGRGSLVKATDTEIYVDHRVVHKYTSGFFTCCYRPFRRKEIRENKRRKFVYPSNVDEQVEYSEFCTEFTDNVQIKDEFIKVECTEHEGGIIYREFFTFPQNPYTPGDPEYNNALNQTDKLSVLMLGFDGMSRLNFIRQMPRTLEFIENRGAISLLGYNKVGYNTFPNLLPVLSGYSEKNIDCWNNKNAVFDNCTFIWDLFKKQGYVTAYGEDTPFMGTFWYIKNGFRKKPVDFYPRPLSVEAERHIASNHRLNVNLCLGNKLSSEVFNNLIKSFAASFRNQLTFGFFWGNSLTHDYLNLPRIGDGDFKRLLGYLDGIGVFNRTMIVLLSDHGIRWGGFRSTYQGFLEERLPFVYLVFPEWFREKYSTAIANLRVNKKRLTSPFDLHETLRDILNLQGISNEEINKERRKRTTGISLFRPISPERKCKDAGIPDEWCACHTNRPLPISSKETQEAAASVVLQINTLLTGYRQCATLKISKLLSARLEEVPNKESLVYSFKDLIVTLETEPGKALFEATVRHKANTGFRVLGAISRLNMYGNQSSCISNYVLKLYCYCS